MDSPTFDLSVVVPTRDMAAHVPALFQSLVASGTLEVAREVIFVDDGSRDETPTVLEAIRSAHPDRVRIVTFDENQGRYAARRRGAREAKGSGLLFLDTRVTLPPDFLAGLRAPERREASSVVIQIDVEKSIFNLYWERTHALLFARNRRDERAGFWLTPETYARYVTGTGGLLCRRADFLAACDVFGERVLKSDDTFLLRELVALRPVFVRDDWCVGWEPRQSLGSFLWRLWDRGPGFVEYHVLSRRGTYFYVLLASFAYLTAGVYLTGAGLSAGPWLLSAIPLTLALSTGAFAKGAGEFVRLMPLHLLVCAAAAAAVIHGLFVAAREGGRA